MTTRERLRALRETNLVQSKSLLDRSHLQDVVELARSRAEYVRDQVYRYWNPDYDSASAASKAKQQQKASAAKTQIRQFRYHTVMDERWWIWNILFALLPAFCIAAFCELRGKPFQEEYVRRQQLAELRLVLGDDDYDEDRALQLIAMRREDVRERTVWEELQGMVHLVQVWWSRMVMKQEEEEEGKDSNNDTDNNRKVDAADEPPSIFPTITSKIMPKPAVPGSAVPATTTTTTTVPATDQNESAPSSSSPSSPTSTPSIEDLLERIRQLEERAALQSSTTTTKKEYGKSATDQGFLEAVEKGSKSGTQRRVEDNIVRKWEEYLDKVAPPSKNREEASTKDDDKGTATATKLTTKFLDMVTPLLWGGETSTDDDDSHGGSKPKREKPPPPPPPSTTTAVESTSNKAAESPSTRQSTPQSSQPILEQPKSADTAAETTVVDRKHHDSQETPALQRSPLAPDDESSSDTPSSSAVNINTSSTETSTNGETADGGKPPWWGRFWPRNSS